MTTNRKSTQARAKLSSANSACELTIAIAELDARLEALAEKQDSFLEKTYIAEKVKHKDFGEGVVVEQREDVLKIYFSAQNLTKVFVLHEKFKNRPIFENDAEVIDAFTAFGNTRQTIIQLKQEKARLEKKRAALL